MLTKKAKTRLLKLVEFMEALPKSANAHFDMATFVNHYGEHHHKFPEKMRMKDLHTCGTTACALGWAATMPYFKRLGLYLNYSEEVQGDEIAVFDMDNCEIGVNGGYMWGPLFGSHNKDKTPKQWAKRVRRLIREWDKPTPQSPST